ncbi:MAG: nucleotidyltransferase domain-containing protein [Candidatus Taylorbacteria bacterium]|nr:nucleotidyltransferase domain-containing protein [Candidatus Taylorbacteria bacterium]
MKNLKLIILFGSKARGTAGKQSDTDVAVLAGRPLTLEEKNALLEKVAERLAVSGERIDLIDLYDAPPLLAHQIGETGTLIEGTRFDFNRFRIRAWKHYLDTAKFRRAREQALKTYVKRTNS